MVRVVPHGQRACTMRRWSRPRSLAAEEHTIVPTTVSRKLPGNTPWPLARSQGNRVIAGVAGGIAERIGVDAIYVRAAFIVLAFAGAMGVLGYLLAWTLADSEPLEPEAVRAPSARRAIGLGCIVWGLLLILRSLGFWFGDAVVWPVALAAVGTSVIWARGDERDRARWAQIATGISGSEEAARPMPLIRLGLGGVLVIGGLWSFLAANRAIAATGGALLAAIVTGAGLGLILGPWIVRQTQQLAEERNERIRSQERADMAAHLHDSVLQTLAMIQRSESPRRMVSLARGQERELRAWLYGRSEPRSAERLEAVLDEAAARIEQLYEVAVELVVVGDTPADDAVRALVGACYEAMQNAARHSSAETISVYVEVEQEVINAYVRDEGKGFDPRHVPDDRGGIAHSIIGRMRRHGGTAVINSQPGVGTEVELALPRRPA